MKMLQIIITNHPLFWSDNKGDGRYGDTETKLTTLFRKEPNMTGPTDMTKSSNNDNLFCLIITVGILAWFRIFLASKMCLGLSKFKPMLIIISSLSPILAACIDEIAKFLHFFLTYQHNTIQEVKKDSIHRMHVFQIINQVEDHQYPLKKQDLKKASLT